MSKALLDQPAQTLIPLRRGSELRSSRVDEEAAARDDLLAGDVEAAEEGEGTVELERAVDLGEVVMRADLGSPCGQREAGSKKKSKINRPEWDDLQCW